MKKKGHRIRAVAPGSIGEELELEPGDRLLAINGQEIEDIFDYEYYVDSESMVMLVEKAGGELWELEIENDYEDLGLTFENGLMSDYRSCTNRCIFCFIDQMPPGMRETLYFKDDDSRLSFLQGNYVTLTNMKDRDIERIIRYKMAPINISVHTTNPELRCRMLHNRFAGEALKKIDRLYEAEIPMNGQIVLCRGINDGAELERTIGDLSRYLPHMESVSVVPVGLTRFRDGLTPLEPFDRPSAEETIGIIEGWQEKLYSRWGRHFIHASDEFYIMAGREMPEEERYDGYPQLENGVGMLRLLDTEVDEALSALEGAAENKGQIEQNAGQNRPGLSGGRSVEQEPGQDRPGLSGGRSVEQEPGQDRPGLSGRRSVEQEPGPKTIAAPARETVSLATGLLAFPYIKKQVDKIIARYPEKQVKVYAVRNDFFGERITVAGLLTGQDIIAQLTGKELGERLLLPSCMFRSGEEVFLDDVTRTQVENALQVKVNIVKSGGWDLVGAVLFPDGEGMPEGGARPDAAGSDYELKEIDDYE